eukprot:2106230-Amphidinium_carterae.1
MGPPFSGAPRGGVLSCEVLRPLGSGRQFWDPEWPTAALLAGKLLLTLQTAHHKHEPSSVQAGEKRRLASDVAQWSRHLEVEEARQSPGPPQRIVSVNPRGWSRMAPLLSKMKEEVILVQETFLAAGSVTRASYEAKACKYHSFYVPALKPPRGRPQGGLAVLSRVATPAVVPHSGVHYAKGRWMHVIVHLEVGGRTLHVFNVYGYDESYPDACEWNRAILDELLPHVHAGDTVVRPPSDNTPTSPYTKGEQGRQIDWFLISPHMRDSAGAEYRLESQPDHYAVGLTLTASWIPQTFLKKVKAPPAVTDHPAEEWAECWESQLPRWRSALRDGDVDAAWDCWNSAATSALGLSVGDRGPLKVQQARFPELQRDPTVTQDLQARHDLELAWYSVQENALPTTHWPSVAGPFVSTQEGQKARLEEVRLKGTKERHKASKASWEKFVKEAAETSPSKLFKWVRGTTKVWVLWDLAVRTPEGWASSPGEVAESELRAWSKLWKPGPSGREPGGHPFLEPHLPCPGGLWEGGLRRSTFFSSSKDAGPTRSGLYLQLPKEGAKEAGQRRPIALLPMIYRLWAAWQKHRVTEWRGLCARRGETPVGTGALDEAFTLAAEAERATTLDEPFAAVFLDCSKCYERVELALLENS